MTLSRSTLSAPPKRICILRLSALGDITHALPVLRTFQQHWPDTHISWIIGKTEFELVKDIEGVEFIIFDKARGLAAYRQIRRVLKQQHFDVLLHMQLSLRASIISALTSADIKLGFDRARAKDLQWLFSNQKIVPASTRQHVVDSFLEFPRHFGLEPVMEWRLPVSAAAREQFRQQIDTSKYLVINPCAVAKARSWRNWSAAGYAAVADYAATQLGIDVVLSGGPAQQERRMANEIMSRCGSKPINLVAQTRIPELVALLDGACAVIAPDTGPAHIASALNTPVIGLYAATNPQRAAPYNFQQYVVNKYPEALEHYYAQSVDEASWGRRIRNDEAMALISPEDVIQMLDTVVEAG